MMPSSPSCIVGGEVGSEAKGNETRELCFVLFCFVFSFVYLGMIQF